VKESQYIFSFSEDEDLRLQIGKAKIEAPKPWCRIC